MDNALEAVDTRWAVHMNCVRHPGAYTHRGQRMDVSATVSRSPEGAGVHGTQSKVPVRRRRELVEAFTAVPDFSVFPSQNRACGGPPVEARGEEQTRRKIGVGRSLHTDVPSERAQERVPQRRREILCVAAAGPRGGSLSPSKESSMHEELIRPPAGAVMTSTTSAKGDALKATNATSTRVRDTGSSG
jgi:hypothetical protein